MPVELRLKSVRESRGLSQFELAQRSGMSPQNIQKMEQGRAKGIQLDTLDTLCEVLECEIQELLVRVSDKGVGSSDTQPEKQSRRGKQKTEPKSESMQLQRGQMVKIPSGARAWVDRMLENGKVALTVEGLGQDVYPVHMLTVTDLVV